MSALPLRLRLALAFALSMAVVLSGLAVFLYVRLGAELQRGVDLGLRARAGAITGALAVRGAVPIDAGRSVIDPDEAFAQVLDSSGAVLDASQAVRGAAMLSAATVGDLPGPTFLTRRVHGINDDARLLATPVRVGDRTLVVVVGTNLGDQQDAQHRLLLLLAVGIPSALLLSTGIGWLIAGAALSPAERMQREALEAERRFLDEASHDLRTPLGVLKAELDLALLRPRSRPELEATLRTAARETDQLVRLTEDLLVLARSRRGPMPLHREEVRLDEFCAECAAPFQAPEHPIAVKAAPDVARIDPVLVRQAVRNLLDNAVRHGGGMDVTVSAERTDHQVTFTVTDAGPGLPPRVPDRLVRGDIGASGFGLSIVAAVADAHGGCAETGRSPRGGGAVRIVLPATVPAPR